ncbi:hypothetical protein M407DRAFT_25162 [Tulasnella calospora MUT 4182]|uniref:Uncharacterized protein n=1 Tax=Tulasnella calospora MUT 4182 TaxID=1051891 RepID=A0A0C3LVQ1_9AGAM|nr:hypothetical protein M407DRAFT_25162 [Tulasnella calospora MUT 4182]
MVTSPPHLSTSEVWPLVNPPVVIGPSHSPPLPSPTPPPQSPKAEPQTPVMHSPQPPDGSAEPEGGEDDKDLDLAGPSTNSKGKQRQQPPPSPPATSLLNAAIR